MNLEVGQTTMIWLTKTYVAWFKNHEKDRIRRHFDGRHEQVILTVFEKVKEHAKENGYTPFFHVMEQVTVKASSIEEAEDLPDGNMYKLAKV